MVLESLEKALEVVIQLSLLDSPSIVGEEHGHAPPSGYWPIQHWGQPPPLWGNPWGPYLIPMQPQMPGSSQPSRKRLRAEDAPSTSSAIDISEEDIDPFISGSDRRELLGSSSENESEEEEETPAAKRSFAPSEDTLKFLKFLSAKPLKNYKRKSTVNNSLHHQWIRSIL